MFKPIFYFLLLFALYHGAEYAFLFHQSIPGFLLLMGCFFVASWWIVYRVRGEEPALWGLELPGLVRKLPLGFALGFGYAGLAFVLSCLVSGTRIVQIPETGFFIRQTALLAFGTLLTSFSEDILIRSLPYRYLRNQIRPVLLVLLTALLYVGNHIYRLEDGWLLLCHLFVLGVLLAIPLVRSGSIGPTLGIHFGMNIVYQLTNNVLHTESADRPIPALVILVAFEMVMIPVVAAFYRPGKQTAAHAV